MPGTEGNTNALKHGARSHLTTGKWPVGTRYMRRQMGELERQLAHCVVHKYGEICVPKVALIQSLIRHEIRAQLYQRWLGEDGLPLAERMALLDGIGRATDSRDKCLKALGIEGGAGQQSLKDVLIT